MEFFELESLVPGWERSRVVRIAPRSRGPVAERLRRAVRELQLAGVSVRATADPESEAAELRTWIAELESAPPAASPVPSHIRGVLIVDYAEVYAEEVAESLCGEGLAVVLSVQSYEDSLRERPRYSPSRRLGFLDRVPALIGGRYRPLRQLGAGAMGIVLHVVDDTTGTQRALKLLRREWVRNEIVVERFSREVRAIAAVHHDPRIVRVVDEGLLSDGRAWFVMDLLEGSTLETLLAVPTRVRARSLLRIFLEIARGLTSAHAAGVIHRDIKPSNIFLCGINFNRAGVRILDFGLARIVKEQPTYSGPGYIGTPGYIAPEGYSSGCGLDAEHMFASVTDRADVFSLGIVMFEAICGTIPQPVLPNAMEFMLRGMKSDDGLTGDEILALDGAGGTSVLNLVDSMVARRVERRLSMATVAQRLEELIMSVAPDSQITIGARAHDATTMVDRMTRTTLEQMRTPDIAATNLEAHAMLKQAIRMGADAHLELRSQDAEQKSLQAAWELTQVMERTLITRLRREITPHAPAWRERYALHQVTKGDAYGLRRLRSALEGPAGVPSLAIMGGWVAESSPYLLESEELKEAVACALGIPMAIREDVWLAGELRNILAHRQEYELGTRDVPERLMAHVVWQGVGGCDLRLREPALQWLETCAAALLCSTTACAL